MRENWRQISQFRTSAVSGHNFIHEKIIFNKIYIYTHLTKIVFVLHLSEVQTHALKLRTHQTPHCWTDWTFENKFHVCHFLKRNRKLRIPINQMVMKMLSLNRIQQTAGDRPFIQWISHASAKTCNWSHNLTMNKCTLFSVSYWVQMIGKRGDTWFV